MALTIRLTFADVKSDGTATALLLGLDGLGH